LLEGRVENFLLSVLFVFLVIPGIELCRWLYRMQRHELDTRKRWLQRGAVAWIVIVVLAMLMSAYYLVPVFLGDG
jgi:nicotinamide riboside transporter PnuC